MSASALEAVASREDRQPALADQFVRILGVVIVLWAIAATVWTLSSYAPFGTAARAGLSFFAAAGSAALVAFLPRILGRSIAKWTPVIASARTSTWLYTVLAVGLGLR